MENPTASQTTSSTCVQNLLLSLRNLQLKDDGIWADDDHNNGGVSTSKINLSSSSSGFGVLPLAMPSNSVSQANHHPFDTRIFVRATSESGSKFLQELLSSSSSEDARIAYKIFYAVYGFLFQFMSDQFARHVFVKIITSCNYYHLQLITQKIASQSEQELFLMTSSNKHGASSIKKLIKVLSISKSPLICYVISALSRLFEDMMITKSGSSIILHCLEALDDRQNDLIYQAAINSYYTVSCHKQGCISMIDFISEMSGSRRQQLLYIICENSVALSKDLFGNFVVQHIMGLENPKFIELTCLALKGQFVDLSLTKCGSHIVEKLLKLKAQVVISYVANDFLNSNRILEVASDIYGNFVIQTALKESMRLNRLMYQRLVMKLQEDPNSLKFGYGKHVYKFITGYSGFSTC
ncbi:hypothetical protein ACOSQ4_013950 [Xanthoceras sorbifolium]